MNLRCAAHPTVSLVEACVLQYPADYQQAKHDLSCDSQVHWRPGQQQLPSHSSAIWPDWPCRRLRCRHMYRRGSATVCCCGLSRAVLLVEAPSVCCQSCRHHLHCYHCCCCCCNCYSWVCLGSQRCMLRVDVAARPRPCAPSSQAGCVGAVSGVAANPRRLRAPCLPIIGNSKRLHHHSTRTTRIRIHVPGMAN